MYMYQVLPEVSIIYQCAMLSQRSLPLWLFVLSSAAQGLHFSTDSEKINRISISHVNNIDFKLQQVFVFSSIPLMKNFKSYLCCLHYFFPFLIIMAFFLQLIQLFEEL